MGILLSLWIDRNNFTLIQDKKLLLTTTFNLIYKLLKSMNVCLIVLYSELLGFTMLFYLFLSFI